MFSERYGWKPIDSAPVDQDVALIVTDGGKPYLLNGPFKLTAAGWVSSGKSTRLAVTPLQWRPYFARPKTARRFPAPWTVIENAESFRAQDAGGQTVGWFYFRHNEETARQAKVLTRDEARRMAVNFARAAGAGWEGRAREVLARKHRLPSRPYSGNRTFPTRKRR
jgi:hypothetical protein